MNNPPPTTQQAPQKPEFVLFIGDCLFSNNFINKLKSKDELMKKINIVSIHKIPVIPNEIEQVPCVYDGKQIYQGKDAFKWLNEKMSDYLSAANDGLVYSFIDGEEEKVFGNYSFIEQKNGSYGIGEQPSTANMNDPTRMMSMNNNDNKNRTLDSLVASRTNDLKELSK